MLLRVRVAADGTVLSVAVATSSGRGILDRAAVAAVEDWTFTPGTRDGVPVAGETDVSIRFQLNG